MSSLGINRLAATKRSFSDLPVNDFLYIALTIAFFFICAAYVYACERL
jgi:hypothetical protein